MFLHMEPVIHLGQNPQRCFLKCRDFPGGPVVKSLLCSARTPVGLIPVWGTKILHAMGQLSLHITVRASLHHHTISHMMDEVMILHAASKTWCIQISKYSKNKMQNLGPYFRPTKPEFLRPGPFLVNKFPRGFFFFSFLFFFFCISLSTYTIYLFIHLRSIYWDKYVPVPTPGVYVAVISPVPGDFYGSCLFLLPKPQPLSLVSLKFPSCGLEKQRRKRPFICVCEDHGLRWWLSGKNPTWKAGIWGSVLMSGRSLGGGQATHSSILVWRIPWTEEPGRLQSMGSQRIRHNWSNLAHVHTCLWGSQGL